MREKNSIKSERAGFGYVTWQINDNYYIRLVPIYYKIMYAPSFILFTQRKFTELESPSLLGFLPLTSQ